MTKNVYMRNAGKERSDFLSDCQVTSPTVSEKTITFKVKQNTGAAITAGTKGVIKIKLDVSAADATTHKTIAIRSASVTSSTVDSMHFNPVTGEVTLHCTIRSGQQWADGAEMTCSVELNGGTINASGSYIESISK